ncbi:DUF1285 domain-containing protein [Aliidiomarina haloalkalitolerans]|uniref:DUF1285 domain-containing protein n=1 Tax=Aliidiomarina haloalkalitolerans TaxID=859059 RepID=A0A432VTZ8_9GAMM|nr:DUF1285 domain-containing protein [Aliidiomarina haloalkalitolerans]MCL4409483.1 DUF1285 domain-containing protein [Gammaproteobacteria bacterium]RUO19913.1 DUF1285 domain-containing protein [Aliidiomarina haloalkalitolerans]
MNLQKLQASLELQHKAPVEKWDPPFCGDIDIRIESDGRWFYMGSPITRQALVKLFATVLKKENDEYFLVTPVEKVRIQVVDLPFVITEWDQVELEGKEPWLRVHTNIGERYVLSAAHPLCVHEKLPAVEIRDQLLARVHRNVYYQWADLAQIDDNGNFYLTSGTERFVLSVEE